MEHEITANDLKTRGVTAIKSATSDGNEAYITVRGKSRYVVIPVEKYNQFREYELEIALQESRSDIKKGRFYKESVEDHIKRITRG